MPDISGTLNTNEWNQVNDRATAFEDALKTCSSVVMEQFLPARGDPLRLRVLLELVKTDLAYRWEHGRGMLLEEYLKTAPELGPARSMPADLLYEEYRARHHHGDRPSLATYQARFPEHFAEFEHLVQARTTAAKVPTQPVSPGPRLIARGTRLDFGGGYVLNERLGSGTFGEVWRARSDGGGFEVAIKIIFHAIDHEDVQRELQALEVIRGLRHHFLLTTQSFWFSADRLYIVMELAQCSLRQDLVRCQREGKPAIPARELLSYTLETAEALDYLHARGVMHRDIKPENILLQEGHVKVADLGLARLQENLRSQNATTSGTPLYMPPEVWQSKLSVHSDQYSLALTYAELRMGRKPFQSTTLMTLMRDHIEGVPDLGNLPAEEQQALLKALAKDPNERFPSCKEFTQALEAALAPARSSMVGTAAEATLAANGATAGDDSGVALGTIASHRTDPSVAVTQPPRPGMPSIPPRPPHPNLIRGVVLVLVLLLLPIGYAVWHVLSPPPPPPLTLEALAPIRVRAGQSMTVLLSLNQVNTEAPLRLVCKGLPDDVKLTPGDLLIPEHMRGLQVQLTAAENAVPRQMRLAFEAPHCAATLDLTILPLATLPPLCSRTEDTEVVTARNGLKYYTWIRKQLPDGTLVMFRVIPAVNDLDPPTFYIMRDKVSNDLFARFARPAEEQALVLTGATVVARVASPLGEGPFAAFMLARARAASGSQWRLGAVVEHRRMDGTSELRDLGTTDGNLPVFRVTALEAHEFARWLGGYLPSAKEWDKAAGRWDKDRQGPFPGDWKKLKADKQALAQIGIGRKQLGPLPLDAATLDVSPYGCRHMSGNGYEWTDTMANPQDLTVAQCADRGFPAGSLVLERGRSYTASTPLLFAKMEDSAARDPLDPSPFIGFRIVLHP